MGDTRQRVVQLSARLAALDAEIAALRQTLVQVERGERDAELPALYLALLDHAALDAAAGASLGAAAGADGADDDDDVDIEDDNDAHATEMKTTAATATATEETKEQDEAAVKSEPGEGTADAGHETEAEHKEDEAEGSGGEGEAAEGAPGTAGEDAETAAAELHALQARLDAVLGAAMRRDRETRFFDHAVTADEAPLYAHEVLCACDFGLLRRRLRRGRYAWPACASVRAACALFVRDLALVFANAAVFNPPGAASGVLELSRKILQSARRHLAEHHIWPLPTPAECAALLPRRRASRAAAVSAAVVSASAAASAAPATATTTVTTALEPDAGNSDADEPADADNEASPHPPSKRRRRSTLAAP